jgi:hypothetical protein
MGTVDGDDCFQDLRGNLRCSLWVPLEDMGNHIEGP